MSYLALPRLGFRGTTASVNPSTANNGDFVRNIDYGRVKLQEIPGVSPPPTDYVAYRAWLMSLIEVQGLGPEMPSEWNYYGDHAVTFGDASINGFWLPDGPPVTGGADAVLGARVALNARMVDLSPGDNYTTQIIAGIFKIVGLDGSGHARDLLTGIDPSVACSRWITWQRPCGAAIFQCVIPNERLTIMRGYSPALDALAAAVARGAGLSVRYCLYTLHWDPTLTPKVMHDRFQRGEYVMHPMIGRVLGSLGVWYAADMRSAPAGRLLYVPGSKYSAPSDQPALPAPERPRVVSHRDLAQLWAVPGQQVAAPGAPVVADPPQISHVPGPAVAVLDQTRQVIMLDVLSTFLERSPEDLTKVDVGPVSLELVYRDTQGQEQVAVVGPIPYDQQTYEDQAGVVEISYAAHPELVPYLESGSLRLRCLPPAAGLSSVLLQEMATVAVETDDRCVYVQQDEEVTITLRVFERGAPIARSVSLQLEQWRDTYYAPPPDTTAPVARESADFSLVHSTYTKLEPDDPALAIPAAVLVPSGGIAQLTIAPRGPGSPGCNKIRFIPPGARDDPPSDPSHPAFDPTIEFFTNFRVLPADDYSHLKDEEITWPFVYKEVFSYYALIHPMMSTIIPWGPGDAPDDPEHLRQFATLIRRFVDEANSASPLYMPITRDLSAGKRKLVQRWCDLQKKPSREL